MSIMRLLGFRTLPCGCTSGQYREITTNREVTYIEEKGAACDAHGHKRNHVVPNERLADPTPGFLSAQAR